MKESINQYDYFSFARKIIWTMNLVKPIFSNNNDYATYAAIQKNLVCSICVHAG